MRKRSRLSYSRYGYYFILPFFLVFALFQVYPMFYTINLSFTDLGGFVTNYSYVGLDNYIWLWKSDLFWKTVGNTFIIWGVNFIPQLAIALLFAALFTSVTKKLKGTGFFKVVFYMPNIITAASVALIFNALFMYKYGPISELFLRLGIVGEEYKFARDPVASRLIVSFIQFWMWSGQTMIMLIACMLSIDPTLYEAGRVDGATSSKMFFKITMPLMTPMMIYMLVTSLVGGLQMFDIPFLFNGGGPDYATETMAVYIYRQAFTGQQNFNIAAAGSVYLLIIAVSMSAVVFKLLNRKEDKV